MGSHRVRHDWSDLAAAVAAASLALFGVCSSKILLTWSLVSGWTCLPENTLGKYCKFFSPGSAVCRWLLPRHGLTWNKSQVQKRRSVLLPKRNGAAPRSAGPPGCFLHHMASLSPAYSTRRESESQTESLASTEMQELNYLWVGSPVSLWGTSPKRLWEFPLSFSQGECLEQAFSMEIPKEFPIPLLQSLGHRPGFKENIEHGSPDNPDLSSYLFSKRVHFRGKYKQKPVL